MEQEIWQEDQPVLASDLDRAQSTKESAITLRLGDEFNPGVVPDSQQLAEIVPFLISVVSSTSINVGTGIAYDSNGQRIFISGPALIPYNIGNPVTQTDNGVGGTVLTPISTGSSSISITAGVANYIYVTYLNTVDPTVFTISEFDNSRLFVSGTDGYRIDIESTQVAPFPSSIFLGEVDASQTVTTVGRPVFNLKPDNLLAVVPQPFNTLNALGDPYAAGQSVNFPYHVSGLGTGVVTPVNVHGLSLADLTGTSTSLPQLFMGSGIANAPQPNAVGFASSALYGVIQPGSGSPNPPGYGYDNFQILPLTGVETLLVNGTTVTAANFTQSYYLFYFISAAGVPLSAGNYTIYFNVTTLQLLLAANGSPANTAYRVYNGTSGTFVNANTLPIATVLANPDNFVLWQIDWLALSGAFQGIAFGSPIDLRVFGTIGTLSLQRDALTDTVVIAHNVDITADPSGVGLGNLTVASDVTIQGTNLNVNGVNYSWPASQGAPGSVLTDNGAGNLTWVVAPVVSQASSSPFFGVPNVSRVNGVAYQNTSATRPIFVSAWETGPSTAASIVGYSSLTNPPTGTIVAIQESPATPNPSVPHIFFVVPPLYWYEFAGSGTTNVVEWQ
jgi:hypothetical protein